MTLRLTAAVSAAALLAAPALAQLPTGVGTIRAEAGNMKTTVVTDGLTWPWGMDFLPDGRMLVTEKPGRLRIVTADGSLRPDPVEGTPEVWAQGQGGLMDVAVDPDFSENGLVWLAYAKPMQGGQATTALGRGRLEDGRLADWREVWVMEPAVEGPNHFGNRIVFDGPDTIFLAVGDRFKFDPAQDLSSGLGKVHRMDRDGEPLPDNPFVDDPDAEGTIWSYGHRNIEAAAIDPETGNFWVAEMGPLGGDELNLIEKGANYGWPVVSWGTDYTGEDIPDPPTRPEFEDAATYWTPVISPSGFIFYEGDAFPEFQGDAFIGGLVSQGLTHVTLDGTEVAGQEHIPLGARIRDVAEGPDGHIYVLIDQRDGAMWKLQPQPRPGGEQATAD